MPQWRDKNQGNDMDEHEAIAKIEGLMQKLELGGYDVSTIRHFFDVGEWLMALEGIENVYADLIPDHEAQTDINALRDYFCS